MTLLAGRYRIDRELGRGAMGVVFLAWDERLDRPVALKELLLQGHLTPELRRELIGRFDHEARAAGRLNHPNIVSVYDVFSDDAHSYIVMEYVEGETLDALIARGPLDPDSAAAIVVQVLQAIDHAHANVVIHRDLKPENVFVQRNGVVKVTDFGIAHVGDATASWTRAGTIVGTVGYMSPEQLRGEPVDQRTDVFAVGVLLYELLTGMNPFGSDTQTAVMYRIAHEEPLSLRAMRTGAPKYLDAVIRKALHKERDQRYQSAAEMAQDIVDRKAPRVRPATLAPPASLSQLQSSTVGSRKSAPTVIGAASDEQSVASLPSTSAAATAGIRGDAGALDESRDPRDASSWRRTGILAVLVAIFATVAVVVAVMALSSNGVPAATGNSGRLIDGARTINGLQAQLVRVAEDYATAVSALETAAKKNRLAVETWKADLKDYRQKVKARNAVIAFNAQEAAKAQGATTTTYRQPETGQLITKTSGGYTPQTKTVPAQPDKPRPPGVDLRDARTAIREARGTAGQLAQDVSSSSVDSGSAPLLELIRTTAESIGIATDDASRALSQAVVKRTFDGQQYTALDQAELSVLRKAIEFESAAKDIRSQLLTLLKANGLTAGDLRPEPTSSPAPSAVVSR